MRSHWVFLLAFFTSIVTAAGTVFVIDKYDLIPHEAPAPAKATVPKLDGLSEADARLALATEGLILIVSGHEPSDEAEGGSVIAQDKPAGTPADKGSVINVTLAEQKPTVPNVVGKTVEEAGALLESHGFKLQIGETKPDPAVPPGQVVSQIPAAEQKLVKGETVTVQVSAPPDAAEVPKVVGLTFNNAKMQIEKAGFKLKARWVRLAEVETYVVLQQEPKAGTKLEKDGDVTITVNRE